MVIPQPSTFYKIISQFVVNKAWDGSPLVLNPNEGAAMPETPNGSMILAYENKSTENNQGKIALTSGGSDPIFLVAPALTNQPSFYSYNWQSNNLNVTNISPPNTDTPIRIQAIGPGMPGQKPFPLPADGTSVPLKTYDSAQGMASGGLSQLIFQCRASTLAVFVLIGGPPDTSGNNSYAFQVNASADTGPGTGKTPPPGYYATSRGNNCTFEFQWGGATVFVANLSAETVTNTAVILRSL